DRGRSVESAHSTWGQSKMSRTMPALGGNYAALDSGPPITSAMSWAIAASASEISMPSSFPRSSYNGQGKRLPQDVQYASTSHSCSMVSKLSSSCSRYILPLMMNGKLSSRSFCVSVQELWKPSAKRFAPQSGQGKKGRKWHSCIGSGNGLVDICFFPFCEWCL